MITSVLLRVCLFLCMLLSGRVVLAVDAQSGILPPGNARCDQLWQSCASDAQPKKCLAQICFSTSTAQSEFEKTNNCKFASKDCTEKWRASVNFLRNHEGKLALKGYVPIFHGKVIGQSGVTVSTGVDLGQQSASGTRHVIDVYIKDNGNSGNVDVDALVKKLNPYFGLKKQKALDALAKMPLTVTYDEATLLEQAFGYDTWIRVSKQFDARGTEGMVFKRLPQEAQTVIIDFAYQYGTSDSKGAVRRTFWQYVYAGEWKKLADWLNSNPDPYVSRRTDEGVLLQSGIDNKDLPESGNPCEPTDTAGR